MRVVLDLPDWVDERNIRITAGVELVAYKKQNEDFWRVKVDRCNMCGDCCTGWRDGFIYPVKDGVCIHLDDPDKEGRRKCKIAINRPRLCDDDPRIGNYERCSITYKRIDQK